MTAHRAPAPTPDLQRVRTFYDSDLVVGRFLSAEHFDRLVWHTQFTLRDGCGQVADETTFLLGWADLPTAGRVLDFGCGAGALCFTLAVQGFDTRGVNISARQVEIARDEARVRGLASASFDVCDGQTLPYADESFDAVLFQESMCHVPDKGSMLREFARVLKPGGVFAGQDFFAGASAPPPAFELATINQRYRCFLQPIARYVALAEPFFNDLQMIDCARLSDCSAFTQFGAEFWPRILKGYFTVGFIRGRKRAPSA